jgi:glycosyltransferase involved in cell wall biosynthesis
MINDYLRFGGAEAIVQNLASWLICKGHEVYVSVRNTNGSVATNFQVLQKGSFVPTEFLGHQISQLIRYDPLAYRHYLRIISEIKPDVIHCHNISSFGTAPILASRTLNVPCVFTAHDYWIISANKNLTTREGDVRLNSTSWNSICKSSSMVSAFGEANILFAPLVKKNLFRRIKDFSTAKIVAVSKFQRSILLSSFPANQVDVIQNGIDINELNSVPKSSIFQRVIFLGGYTRNKGVKHYKMVAEIVNRNKHVADFVATGQSSNVPSEFSQIRFTGILPRLRLLSLMRGSVCLVFPSLWPEPSPLAIMEAMGLGVPVVAYNVGGIPEIVEDNVNGFLVKLGDYQTLAELVTLLINHKKKRQELSIKALETIHSRHSLNRMAKQYEDLYYKLC